MSYYTDRLSKLNITDEINQVLVWRNNAQSNRTELQPVKIFREHDKGIEIIVYTITRELIRIEKDGSRMKRDWSIIRLEKPFIKPDGGLMKYQMPKGQGSYPFFPPALLDKYEQQISIQTLFITEGFFKAFKGAMHGIDIVGIASITHMKNKETGELHEDILKLIKQCKVQRVVWLTDGDCFDVSSKALDPKENIDLYKRPASFYASIATFKQLLDDYECDKYFVHIDTDAIIAEKTFITGTNEAIVKADVKGLDDLLCSFPEKEQDILADLYAFSKPGLFFKKYNITTGLSKVYKEFRLNNVNDFFLWHAERKEVDKNRDFIFNGTKFKYDEEKGECQILVPGDAKNYFRVGTTYFKFVHIPNKYKQLERQFHLWDKGTISDDHGKNFQKHIPKYQAFCNVPDHVNYQQVINSCFNVYNPLDYAPADEACDKDDCPNIYNFIHHIFGSSIVHFTHPKTREKKEINMMDMALDYIQLLYQKPAQKLPILCLVSKENNTGKSTFGKLMKQILGGNAAVVGNQDLAGDFNKHWATKCLVICDETKIDKQAVIEKVKSLSTAEKIMMNSKGKDHVEIDCFIKFMFITNNEENFIYASEDDIRYWIIKVPTIKEENPSLMENMIEEIPAFLSFLNQRKMATDNLNRMWFHPSLLRTEALRKVIAYSKPTIEKELLQYVRDMFMDFGVEEFMMSADDIRNEVFGKKYERNYLAKVLKENFKLDNYHVFVFNNTEYATDEEALMMARRTVDTDFDALRLVEKKYKVTRYEYPRWEEVREIGKSPDKKRVIIKGMGRPFVFRMKDFFSPDEIKNISRSDEEMFLNGMTAAAAIPSNGSLPF